MEISQHSGDFFVGQALHINESSVKGLRCSGAGGSSRTCDSNEASDALRNAAAFCHGESLDMTSSLDVSKTDQDDQF